jgi:hypothetical protein
MLESREMTNTLWVAANIMFDLETGKTTQVLLLSPRESDATTFKEDDAKLYLEFVQRRAPLIKFGLWSSVERPGLFVIRGIQDVT